MEEGLSTAEQLRLGIVRRYYSVARSLGLGKIREWLEGAQIATDAVVWLLGTCYGGEGALHEEALEQLVLHFQSIICMTYRDQFTPIAAGDALLRSDSGWGCTLRSGQMVLAQALQRHWLGRGWRWPDAPQQAAAGAWPGVGLEGSEPPEGLRRLLQLFWDAPSDRNPLSIHNLCTYGRPCGVHPGKWLGPWAMCHALAKTAAQAQQPLGVRVAVIAEPGGGAPMLSIGRFELHFSGGPGGGGAGEAWELLGEGRESASLQEEGQAQDGLLLLVPLVLGLGKLNPVYIPQLQAVLRFPQSVGIVGGRPSSSLYFVGYQADRVIFLDPHDMQPAACSDGDWQSFRCRTLRTMPLPSMDPSLALGFYCRDLGEYRELCERLADLERRSGGAPLLCVTSSDDVVQQYDAVSVSQWVPDEMSDEDGAEGCSEGGEGEPPRGDDEAIQEEAECAAGHLLGERTSGPGGWRGAGSAAAGECSRPEQQGGEPEQLLVPGGGAAASAGPAGGAGDGPRELLSPAVRQASGKGGWELL